jgi:glucose/arabinose dehydrogenase
MLATRDSRVYLTRPDEGDVLMLTDMDGNGVADPPVVAVSGLNYVHGIVFDATYVYLATVNTVYRATVVTDGRFGTPTALVSNLPDGGQHPLRTLGIGPDSMLYISVGSSCDACAETNPEHATILRTGMDGMSRTVFARGLRNTIGFDWHPETDLLWGVDNGSDWRGDALPPEELNQVVQGKNYGWPYCFAKQQVDPIIQDPPGTTKAAYCATTEPSTLENDAHGAPIGMTFYTGTNFPAEYVNNAFVALRGSWNRLPPTGYKIVRVVFDTAGNPTRFEDFVSGFLNPAGTETFARPAGVEVGPDGSLLFTDDSNGVIYRVRYGT